jgi:hypothetical protein
VKQLTGETGLDVRNLKRSEALLPKLSHGSTNNNDEYSSILQAGPMKSKFDGSSGLNLLPSYMNCATRKRSQGNMTMSQGGLYLPKVSLVQNFQSSLAFFDTDKFFLL